MEKKLQVSIIIPCYNSEKYVTETLDSVIEQTYEIWECIIVDDHSTDNTWRILEDYQYKYPDKIFLYKNPRKGACAARNIGMEKSKGEYLKFLDSDDILFDKNIIKKQIEFLQKTQADIAHGIEIHYNNVFEINNIIKKRGGIISLKKVNSFFKNFPITSNFIASRKKFFPLEWDESLSSGQEFDILFRAYTNGLKFSFQKTPYCKIRAHGGIYRISNMDKFNFFNNTVFLYKKLISHLNCDKIEDNTDLKKEIKNQLIIHRINAIRFSNITAFEDFGKIINTPSLAQSHASLTYCILYKISIVNKNVSLLLYKILNRLRLT
ncbi:glycosyl transferase family 2 [Pseudopedobacter saltans DSM 12145]|uniref:Glycosyl transferase family 2 n=1 Tax=Pseudopedobacter saltans (strain ATCC 51119 / DSM 12145 / JCM 21818 / CCUG 39354 / LMG 10337 / NBRC 100064 / NCIMB 13643) TaxID=762903 RepID=F0SD86_PSESL|nr:glycosyltransferase family A protein [Pseudopedobacter saltans]ADY52872.1 glycosyl transferase family 2 [Pseudopedobacter saltans DSM 12145]